MQNHPWPPLFDTKPALMLTPMPWIAETLVAQFVAQQVTCLWLSSCWPAFAPTQSRDIIAGGFIDWLVIEQEHELVQIQPASNLIKLESTSHAFKDPQMPQTWMAAQLPDREALELPDKLATPGWYGGLGYGYNQQQVGLTQPVQKSPDWPNGQLGFARWVITLDYEKSQATLCSYGLSPAELQVLIKHWSRQLQSVPELKITNWQPSLTKTDYAAGFDQIQAYINAGDAYQVNYAQRFSARWQGQPMAGFLKLKQASPSPYSAYWATPFGVVLSHSPELLLQTFMSSAQTSTAAKGSNESTFTAVTKPIKGTTPRHSQADLDTQAAQELRLCPKNRAENTMIVDLLRNDLSRFAQPGSMRVNKLCSIESYAHIHHLVSEIRTEIQAGVTPMQVLLACFPGGSITGAPKRRAMEIIDELEVTPRDSYCGCLGFWDSSTNMIFNITIRTLQFNPITGLVHIWAGGGIVKDSTLDAEYQECFDKVQKLMDLLDSDSS